MKMKFNTKELVEKISFLSKATKKSWLNFQGGQNSFILGMNDNIIVANTTINCNEKSIENLKFSIDGKYLLEILRKIPNEEVFLEIKDHLLNVTSSKIKFSLKLGENIYNNIITPFDETKILFKKEFTYDEFYENLDVAFATLSDESRPIFQGILMDFQKNICNFVATNTHRLAMKTTNTVEEKEGQIIMHKSILNARFSENKNINLEVTSNLIRLTCGDEVLQIATLVGKYPDYSKIIPNNKEKSVLFNKLDLLNLLNRCLILTDKSMNCCVNLEIKNDTLIVTSQNKEIGNVREEMDISSNIKDCFKIAFNAVYLIEGISKIKEDNGFIYFNTPLSPILILGENDTSYQYVVTPLRCTESK